MGMLHGRAAVINHYGASQRTGLLSAFEAHFAGLSLAAGVGDQIKEATVILSDRAASDVRTRALWTGLWRPFRRQRSRCRWTCQTVSCRS